MPQFYSSLSQAIQIFAKSNLNIRDIKQRDAQAAKWQTWGIKVKTKDGANNQLFLRSTIIFPLSRVAILHSSTELEA